MRKRVIRRLAAHLFCFLILCTLLSGQVQRMILPQVTLVSVEPGTVIINGEAQPYDYTVPVSALQWEGDICRVFYVSTKQGQFGEEQIAYGFPVEVVALDDTTAALEKCVFDIVIGQSDKTLMDGIRVMTLFKKSIYDKL